MGRGTLQEAAFAAPARLCTGTVVVVVIVQALQGVLAVGVEGILVEALEGTMTATVAAEEARSTQVVAVGGSLVAVAGANSPPPESEQDTLEAVKEAAEKEE